MFALPGYQIGTFTLPYIGGALGPYGILVTCMFDMGNALFACGGDLRARLRDAVARQRDAADDEGVS